MSVIPIDEAGIEAFEAVFYREFPQDGSDPTREAIAAYLEAAGARVEDRGEVRQRLDGSVCRVRQVQERRLVTPWVPLTDTKEETDGC